MPNDLRCLIRREALRSHHRNEKEKKKKKNQNGKNPDGEGQSRRNRERRQFEHIFLANDNVKVCPLVLWALQIIEETKDQLWANWPPFSLHVYVT